MARSASLGTSVPVLAVVNGVLTTTRLDVARHLGKRHDACLQADINQAVFPLTGGLQ